MGYKDENWIILAQIGDQKRALLNTAISPSVSTKGHT
jgi:hypothetical protein